MMSLNVVGFYLAERGKTIESVLKYKFSGLEFAASHGSWSNAVDYLASTGINALLHW